MSEAEKLEISSAPDLSNDVACCYPRCSSTGVAHWTHGFKHDALPKGWGALLIDHRPHFLCPFHAFEALGV